MTDVLYPVWRFHPTKPACIVQNAEEDAQLGKGWVDSPNKFNEDKKLDKPKPDNDLPGGGRLDRPDNELPDAPGRPERPDQGLPGRPERPDQGLPGTPGGPRPDNELPDTPEPKRKK
jgi:hypothetical protein